MAGYRALEEAVIPLDGEEGVFRESGLVELVVNIGRDDSKFVPGCESEQIAIEWQGRWIVAVELDVASPIGPTLLVRRKRVETSRIYVGEPVPVDKIREVLCEPSARV